MKINAIDIIPIKKLIGFIGGLKSRINLVGTNPVINKVNTFSEEEL